MEGTERKQMLHSFRGWVLGQASDNYQMRLAGEENQKIILEAGYCRGEVAFYPQEIVELCVVNKADGQNIFYLHFQMGALEYAKERFQEMREAMETMTAKPPAKILLSCSCGITTYYFMDKLNQTAKLLNLDYAFSAVPYTSLYSEGGQYDAIFLAPQIAYMCGSVKKTLPNVRVEAIPPKLFASYDVRQFYELLENTLQKENITASFPKPTLAAPPLDHSYHLECKVLAIALIRKEDDKFRCMVRLYEKGSKVLYQKEIIKKRFSLDDFCDICDIAFARYSGIHAVSIALPGIVDERGVTLKRLKMDHTDLAGILSNKYGTEVTVENDANCIALGYYASQKEFRSLSVLYQPVIGQTGGMGSIHEGNLIKGLHNVAGEIQYMPVIRDSLLNPLWGTPEGVRRLAAQYLSSVISILGPELILLVGELFWDTETLGDELRKIIPDAYVPEIRHIKQVQDYMLLGAMVACGCAKKVV
ncbi:MAG: ROK family protein [Lachnospiraceae bacterium]|nr:ROK family protein [Lachnospiraceae bacterium]